MSGNPKRRADLARLRSEPSLGDEAITLLSEGVTMSRICTTLQVSKAALLEWLDEEENAERASRARARAADALADEALDIADESRDARLRIQQRNWVAERFNRQRFGQTQKIEVSGNITHLHLAALQARKQQPAAQAIEQAQPDVVDVEVKTLEQQLAEL